MNLLPCCQTQPDYVCFVTAPSLTLWNCWMGRRCRGPWPILFWRPNLPKACCWTTSRRQVSLSTWTPGHGTSPSTMTAATWSRCYSTALRLVRTGIDILFSYLPGFFNVPQALIDYISGFLHCCPSSSVICCTKQKPGKLLRLILTRVTFEGNFCCFKREFSMAAEILYKGEDSSSNNDRAC